MNQKEKNEINYITGATSGTGYECAVQLARIAPDDQIIIACRDFQAGNDTIRKIKQKTGHNHLICLPIDLTSLASIRQFKEHFVNGKYNKIIALINNAGI